MDNTLEQDILSQHIQHNLIQDQETELEHQMLELLGLLKRPSKSGNYPSLSKSSSRFLYEIYQTMHDNSENLLSDSRNRYTRSTNNFITDYDKMEIEKCNNIITFSSINNQNQQIYDIGMEIYFNTNEIPKDFLLRRAELRLYQNISLEKPFVHNVKSEDYTISVYIGRNHKNNNEKYKLLTSFNTTLHYKGWLQIDVTSALTKWLNIKNIKNNYMFIKVYKTDNLNLELQPAEIGLMNPQSEENVQPFLVGFFNGPEIISNLKTMRLKRNIPKRNRREGKHHRIPAPQFKSPKICQRMNFSVDFRDLDWQNWIIAPEKFEAYFCSGECNFPLGNGMNATNHALVQTLMHLKKPWLPKPCCAPKDLSSISVLYHLNDENVNLRKYRHMVADSCGCH